MNKALWGALAGMGLAIAVFWSMGSVGEGAVRREQAITERVAAEQREATERMRIAAQADVQRTGHLGEAAVFLFAWPDWVGCTVCGSGGGNILATRHPPITKASSRFSSEQITFYF